MPYCGCILVPLRLVGWLVGWSVGRSVGQSVGGWLVSQLVGWLVSWSVGWLVGWSLVSRLLGHHWLVGWSAGLAYRRFPSKRNVLKLMMHCFSIYYLLDNKLSRDADVAVVACLSRRINLVLSSPSRACHVLLLLLLLSSLSL
jgi:hypothetical protein